MENSYAGRSRPQTVGVNVRGRTINVHGRTVNVHGRTVNVRKNRYPEPARS